MEHIRLPGRSWVVVCDGAKSLIFQNDGDATLPNLILIEHLEQRQPLTHSLGVERPGRVFQSHGGARSAVEQTDWHAQNEASFLERVAARLDHAAQEHSFKHLVVAAPPRALGVLRKKMTPEVRALVLKEIDKDMAQLTTREIERRFAPSEKPLSAP
jgi:protein required for attachment to host cells